MSTERAFDAKTDSASKQRLRLWLRLLKASRLVAGVLRDRFRDEHDTTLPRFDVLAALYREKAGLKMSALSGVLRVSNGNVTGIVDRLAEDGLLVRVPVEGDGRATLVRLTRRGSDHFAELSAQHESWINDLLSGVGPREAAELSRLLQKIVERIENGEKMP